MSENMVAIRCKSEMNRWMDSVMVVPQEQADDIEQSIKERMRGFERNGSCYGDVMRRGLRRTLASKASPSAITTRTWTNRLTLGANTVRASARRCPSSRLTSVSWGTT